MPTYSKPSLAHMDALAAQSARFYESLRAHFDLVFNDVLDRDAGFYRVIYGNPHVSWELADFQRHDVYIAGFTRRTHVPMVLWQLPLGNTTLNDTWTHFRDNRVQWWLGNGSEPHLRATRNAGVIGLLFGGGASGTTSVQTDGGLFFRLAGAILGAPAGARLGSAPSRYVYDRRPADPGAGEDRDNRRRWQPWKQRPTAARRHGRETLPLRSATS